MGSSKDLQEKGSSAAELFSTPEVLRRDASASQVAGRPGEKTPERSRSSRSAKKGAKDAKAPSKMRSRMRSCGHSLAFVPWMALLSLALLVAGLVVFAIKAKHASSAATDLLAFLASPTDTGFPAYMSAWDSSIWATVGVAGAACAFLVFSAAVRLDQKLRKTGKYGRTKGAYDVYLYKFYSFLSWLGVLILAALALWATINGVLLASWATQTWNLKEASPAPQGGHPCVQQNKGSAVAAANVAALSARSSQYTAALDGFDAAQRNAAVVEQAPATAQPTPAAQAAPAATGGPATDNTNKTPAEGKQAPTDAKEAAAAGVKEAAPAAPTDMKVTTKAVAAAAPAPAATSVDDAVGAFMAEARTITANITEVVDPEAAVQTDGLCPSAACLNMALYPFTESTSCVCTAASTLQLSSLADEANSSAVWALIGAVGLCVGALFGAMELAANTSMLSADQLFLKVMKRRSSSSGGSHSSSPTKEGRSSSFSQLPGSHSNSYNHLQPGVGVALAATLPSRSSAGYLSMNARG